MRTLAWATLVNTVGMGLWSAGAVLFLTRNAGLSPESVGLGLTIAALVGLSASVPLGNLADRWDPRSLRVGDAGPPGIGGHGQRLGPPARVAGGLALQAATLVGVLDRVADSEADH